jgi:hypothetical protein
MRQSVDRLPDFRPVFLTGTDESGLLDASISYRLPRRRGIVSIEARNLTDRHFLFRDDNFRRSEAVPAALIPERSVLARVALYF